MTGDPPQLIIPIIEVIDRESQSVVALASDDVKASAMVKALNARDVNGYGYYADPPLPVDCIAF
jgi:hypothetical protein